MSSIIARPLTSLLSAIIDNRGRSCPTADSGFPLIATNCIKQDRLYPVFENVRYVDQHTRDEWFRGHPQPEDIIFVCKGSPGRVAMVPDPVSFCIAQDMVAIRADVSIVNPRYLYYLLSSPEVQRMIVNMHVGTMIPHFKKGDFGKLVLGVHSSTDEQKSIAEVLRALDEKIAANRTLLDSAESLATARFSQMHDASFKIPLSATAQFVNGKAFTKGASGTGRVVVRIAELNSGIGGSTVFSDAEVEAKHVACAGDVLFAWSGSLTLHRWYRDEAIVNQHIFKVIPAEGYSPWILYQLIAGKLQQFKNTAADKATTMGHIQRHHLDELVSVPCAEQLERYGPLMEGLWDRALAAEQESEMLSGIRDTLLPRLMSGELRVRDAEKVVEEVL